MTLSAFVGSLFITVTCEDATEHSVGPPKSRSIGEMDTSGSGTRSSGRTCSSRAFAYFGPEGDSAVVVYAKSFAGSTARFATAPRSRPTPSARTNVGRAKTQIAAAARTTSVRAVVMETRGDAARARARENVAAMRPPASPQVCVCYT